MITFTAMGSEAKIGLDKRFIDRMRAWMPGEADALLNALDTEPAISIFLNPKKYVPDPFPGMSPVPYAEHGRFLEKRPSFTLDPLFHAGCYYVIESSSMFLSYLIDQVIGRQAPLSVLDLCAAPGGKSAILMSQLPEGSLLVANEVNKSRWNILRENLSKWGSANVVSLSRDPSRLPWDGQFDMILVDAPCSGEGLFRKDPEARGQWSPENVGLCSARQRRILHEAVRLLRPGGNLIYSTCTFNDDENIRQVSWLSETYAMESCLFQIPDAWHIHRISHNGQYGYQFLPHKVRGEGFFCSVVKKPATADNTEYPEPIRKPPARMRGPSLDLKAWLQIDTESDEVWIQEDKKALTSVLLSRINPDFIRDMPGVRFGTEIGHQQGRVFTPSHTLALSCHLRDDLRTIDLEAEAAVRYLRKEPLPAFTGEPGWYLVRYQGFPLGWAKQTGSGLKNYFPTHLRIRQGK